MLLLYCSFSVDEGVTVDPNPPVEPKPPAPRSVSSRLWPRLFSYAVKYYN